MATTQPIRDRWPNMTPREKVEAIAALLGWHAGPHPSGSVGGLWWINQEGTWEYPVMGDDNHDMTKLHWDPTEDNETAFVELRFRIGDRLKASERGPAFRKAFELALRQIVSERQGVKKLLPLSDVFWDCEADDFCLACVLAAEQSAL